MLLTYKVYTFLSFSHKTALNAECRFCYSSLVYMCDTVSLPYAAEMYFYTRIPANMMLAITPTSVESSAPANVYRVLVTLAARK